MLLRILENWSCFVIWWLRGRMLGIKFRSWEAAAERGLVNTMQIRVGFGGTHHTMREFYQGKVMDLGI
jgi:hypothetical protein